jgi:hypothetical protein
VLFVPQRRNLIGQISPVEIGSVPTTEKVDQIAGEQQLPIVRHRQRSPDLFDEARVTTTRRAANPGRAHST